MLLNMVNHLGVLYVVKKFLEFGKEMSEQSIDIKISKLIKFEESYNQFGSICQNSHIL